MTNSPEIRTRYAPSPTGYLHVGGLRTALYNYLYARAGGGKFLLRVEDTDRARLVEGAVENFLDVFSWLGMEFDEGPRIGGNYGPYVQSERLALYRERVAGLASAGNAYPCFCTSETLDAMRAAQQAAGRPPMYDRRCRTLDRADAARRVAEGEAHVWRLSVPEGGTIVVRDLIRGDVSFDTSTIDDQVLVKSDGYPTYHLANVVDDHLMRISHVIRGEEWLPSTPKHLLLYGFFGWTAPQFAHLPLLLNADRSKMSKRSGDVAVEAYREKGVLPEALLNFVALLGWHPSDEREIFSLDELVKEFSLERVNKAGAVFDAQKLSWMNAQYLAARSGEQIWSEVSALLPDELSGEALARVRYAVETVRGGAESFGEIAARVTEAFAPRDSGGELSESQTRFLTQVADDLSALPAAAWSEFEELARSFKSAASARGKACGLQGKQIWMTLRAALTGREHGPELGKLIAVWGREGTLNRLHAALAENISAEPRG